MMGNLEKGKDEYCLSETHEFIFAWIVEWNCFKAEEIILIYNSIGVLDTDVLRHILQNNWFCWRFARFE